MADQFLSHLCGGEAPTAGRLALRIFLSHLCGGEERLCSFSFGFFFLSHLCGGEATRSVAVAMVVFLSHLCGGEDDLLDDKGRVDFSKPPMRW